MDSSERDSFFRDLAEKLQEINVIFDDYDVSPPSTDCDDEDCNIPDDDSVITTLHKLFREGNVLLEDYFN